MKKIILFMATLCLLTSMLSGLSVAAAPAGLQASASTSSVTIGGSVSITLRYNGGDSGIGAIDAKVSYNDEAFQFVSCAGNGFAGNGSGGVIRLSYYAAEAVAPKTATATLTFKAIAPGGGNFAVTTEGMWNDDDALLGTPGAKLSVSAINPTKSGNADLSSLKPSSGTLTPAFSAKTTHYTISVPYSTSSLNLSATPAHKAAKTAISGENALKVGKNTRVITVTAESGITKKYTVVITRAQKPATTPTKTTIKQPTATQPTGDTTKPTTTPTQPVEDQLEVTVDGVLMNVQDTQPDVKLPADFAWASVTFNGVEVSAAKNEKTGMLLLYLVSSVTDDKGFFIYNEAEDTFVPFRQIQVDKQAYVLHSMPADMTAPQGTVTGTLELDGITAEAYLYTDSELADYALLYVTAPNGNAGLYTYDKAESTLQRYHETPASVPTQPAVVEEEDNAFMTFLANNRTQLLTIAAVLGGVALLCGSIAVVIVVARRPRTPKRKH